MTTYRSTQEFKQRFDGDPIRTDAGFKLPVEDYLYARGRAYAEAYVPEAFVCLSESIDLHRIDPARVRVPTTLVAVREDQLVPLADMQLLNSRLAGPHRLVELSSPYGHDAFLKEAAALKRVFDESL
jgi:homoserine O-acetyltransferase